MLKVAPAPVDPALERERLASEMKRWEAEPQRWEAEQVQRKLQKEEDMRKWEAEQEEKKQKLDFEKMKAEQDHQRWMADRDDNRRQEQAAEMQREAEQKRQDERERLKAERKDDSAARARKYGEAIRWSVIPMGADLLDAVVFFRQTEQLFADYKIPPEFQANVISPFSA